MLQDSYEEMLMLIYRRLQDRDRPMEAVEMREWAYEIKGLLPPKIVHEILELVRKEKLNAR